MEFSTWITIVLVAWVFCSTAIMVLLLRSTPSSALERTDREQTRDASLDRPPRDESGQP